MEFKLSASDAIWNVNILSRAGCRIEFWPRWISTRGVLIQRAVIRIQRFFRVELRPPETGGHCITTPRRIKFGPPLNCYPGSLFHVALWPQALIPRYIVTPRHDSMFNCDLGIQFGTMIRVIIQREILTRGHKSTLNCDPGHNSTLNSDPGSWFHVELWPGSRFHVEFWPGSWFHVKLWPRVLIPRWIVTPS